MVVKTGRASSLQLDEIWQGYTNMGLINYLGAF